ncbi:MAG: hypothetical protein E7Z90_00280 [Cyanobacteria bacterium SIG29]|nr:hypothetical protein [Cyanobacteria bacterium SIG29]
MKNKKTVCEIDIETSLNEVNNLENYIGNFLDNENFSKLNYLSDEEERQSINIDDTTAEFVSIDIDSLAPYSKLITEKEFFKIVGSSNGKTINKRSGLYQESLFGHYLEAKALKDEGYIEDVLKKAVILKYNESYVKSLMNSKKFMKEWRKNFGNFSPLKELRQSGNLRKINTIKNSIF